MIEQEEDKILKLLFEHYTFLKENGCYGLCRDQLFLIEDYLRKKDYLRKLIMNFKLKPNITKFEIEPGIVISKLDLKDGDTIIITIDDNIHNFDTTYEMCEIVSREFPNNKVLTVRKGIEINAADGSSLN